MPASHLVRPARTIGPARMLLLTFAFALIAPASLRAEAPVASLADGREGIIFFASSTPTGPDQYLEAPKAAPGAVVSGVLRLPEGRERVPAVVLTHSAGGVSTSRDLAWAERFKAMGMATFVVDSFTPRGVKGLADLPSFVASVADVYAALGLLATHPRIDATRIALMGFSRGGTVALVAALEPIRHIGAPGGARFAAHVALYPACNTRYLAAEITGAPMLMLLAGADDQTPPAPCHRYGEWLRAKGAVSKVVEYPGARHLFDGSGPAEYIASAVGGGRCDMEYDTETRVTRRTDTGAVMAGAEIGAYFGTCATHGVHLGSDPQARAAAEREIAAHFKAALRLQ